MFYFNQILNQLISELVEAIFQESCLDFHEFCQTERISPNQAEFYREDEDIPFDEFVECDF